MTVKVTLVALAGTLVPAGTSAAKGGPVSL